MKRKFSNRREWHEFITAVHCAAAYPKAIESLRAHTQRINASFSAGRHWLIARTPANRVSER